MRSGTIFDDKALLDKCLPDADIGRMELIFMVVGLLVLDVLALRFGVDSRLLDVRDHDMDVHLLASPAATRRPSLRVRLARGLYALAEGIEPSRRRLQPSGLAHTR